jgi:transcriptional regulator with XRE-family HTH domain
MATESDVHVTLQETPESLPEPIEVAGDVAVGVIVNDGPNELAIDMGVRLRLIRERNGLSQRELAKRAGITNSNISMIEQGLVSPSINSLARVLSGIPMTLAQFFACDPLDVGTVVYSASTLECHQIITAGGIIKQAVAAEKPQRKLDMLRECYPAGCDTGAEPLRPSTEVSAILMSGQLELTVGMQVHQLNPGDAFYLVPQQPYRIRNRSPQEAMLITTGLFGAISAENS